MPQMSQELIRGEPPSYSSPLYNPPQYLLSSTGLSRDELVAQYEEFIQSLQRADIAPELVFERFIGNLKNVFNTALTQQHAQHAAALEDWRREKVALQADLVRATAAVKRPESVSPPLHNRLPTVILPVVPKIDHIYLQFWHSSVPGTKRVHLGTTSVPIPYGLSGSWPGMEQIRSSTDYGSYDTHMDPLITDTTLPTTVTHIVRFKNPFPTPPIVLVWLTGLGANCGNMVCVKATANNVTQSEFTLHISCAGGQRLGSVGVAWAVWPEVPVWGQATGKAGSVSTVLPADVRLPNLSAAGKVAVVGEVGVVFASLCAVDIVLRGGLWINVQMVNGTSSFRVASTTWEMEAGPVGSEVYSMRIAYASR